MVKINLFSKFDQIRTHLRILDGIPLVQGVYFLCDGSELLYIGSSGNIIRRVGQHLENKLFNRVYYLNLNKFHLETVRTVELVLIRYFAPSLNVVHVGEFELSMLPKLSLMQIIDYIDAHRGVVEDEDTELIKRTRDKIYYKFYWSLEEEAKKKLERHMEEERARFNEKLNRLYYSHISP